MSVKIYLEVGHTATLKSKATQEGFTHDWELFVRGIESNNISRYVDKVIFNLHESFPKPKRAVKDAPYIVKESGYAGFEIPIDIYFRGQGRDDPKKFSFVYDLNLQLSMSNHNVEKREHTFSNPSPELRRKLLDNGGVLVGVIGQMDDRSRDGVDESRSQLISKPKLSGSDSKKHKNRTAPLDDGPKPSSTFANLFGTPITKTSSSKVSPEQKTSGSISNNSSSKVSGNSNNSKQSSQKSSDKVSSKDKSEKSSKEKKDKSKYNSPLRDGSGGAGKDSSSSKKSGSSGGSNAFDDKRGRDEKRKEKNHIKERERSKDKSQKRPPSPKPRSRSPPRNVVARPFDAAVSLKRSADDDKPTGGSSSSSAKKSKKDKKDKDKERERIGEKKDKESKHQSKDRDERPTNKVKEQSSDKLEIKRDGGNNTPKEIVKEKSSKAFDVKPIDSPYDQSHVSEPKYQPSSVEKRTDKSDKDVDRKHKHKKKDKNKEKEKARGSSKERKKDKDKTLKQKDTTDNSHLATSSKSGAVSHGLPTPPQPKKNPLGTMMNEINTDSSESDMDVDSPSPSAQPSKNASSSKLDVLDVSEHSNSQLPDMVVPKVSLPLSSHSSSRSPAGKLELNGAKYADKVSKRAAKEAKAAEKADRKRKRKDKDEQSASGDDKRMSTPSPMNGPPTHKIAKKDESSRMHHEKNGGGDMSPSPSFVISTSLALVSSPSPSAHHSNSNDQFTSSSPANGASPQSTGDTCRSPHTFISIDYITELKALQHKIMALEDNTDLQQVVEMIAATGCYEITSKTFDFDLCALDRITVQRLQEFFAATQSVL